MKFHTTARLVLLLIALGSLAVWGFRQWERSQATPSATSPVDDDLPRIDGDQVVMTYFTSGVRCRSCKEIERLSRETAAADFATELSNKRLVFRVINTDEPGKGHFVDRYQLTSKTVIIAHRSAGRETSWNDMAAVWYLLDQPEEFRIYLGEEIRRHLQL